MTTGSDRQSRVTRRSFLRVAAGSVLALAGLSPVAGCTPQQSPPPSSAPVAAPTPTAAKAAAPTPASAVAKAKQEIKMGIGTDVVIMDTRIVQPAPAKSMIFHVEEPLIWPDNEGKPLGILTSSWEPVANPPGWRFKLRPGLKFSNGEPFNAESVKYTIQSILDPSNKSWVHPDPIARVNQVVDMKIEDDQTILLITKSFYRALPINTYERPMLPPKYGAEKGKEYGVNPIGTGHYKFVEYGSKTHLALEADTSYPGNWEGKAKNDSLDFRFLPENATRVAALEAGEVHLIDNLPPDAVDRIKKNPNLDVMVTPTTRINGMNFHCNRPPFDNLKARLAVATAIDRNAIVHKIMGGMTEVANAPFPPGTLGLAGQTFKPYEYDINQAKQYFKEAGLTNGTKIKVGGPVGRYINDKQVVTAVASMISEVGFDPQIEQLEFGTYWPKVTNGDYDLFYVGWATFGYDPVDFTQVYTGWSADNGGATHFVEQNKKVVELLDAANSTTSQQEGERYYGELSRLIWDNVPIAQLFYEPNIAGVSKKLKGWQPRRDTMVYLWNAYLE